MDNHEEELLLEIDATVDQTEALHERLLTLYTQAVEAVIGGKITDEEQIEHLLDGIIDLGDDVRFLKLSEKMHKHIYFHYPQLVGEYTNLYRTTFEGSVGNELCDS